MRKWALTALLMLLAGCGDDASGPADGSVDAPSGDGATDGGGDETPPEIRDVRVLLGVDERALDVSAQDQSRVLLMPEPIVFRVFASDDVDDTEALVVELFDPVTGEPVTDQMVSFERGLHLARTEATAGTSFGVRVRDTANNETSWPHHVIFPTREEALARTWTRLVIDDAGLEIARPTAVYADGEFCREGFVGPGGMIAPGGGTYEVLADGRLRQEARHALPCDTADYGAEWDSVEETAVGDFYVDDVNFSDLPYTRMAGTAPDLVGTWTRTVDLTLADGSEDEVVEVTTYADDGTFSRDVNGTVHAGTYTVAENGSYEENFGDFLYETVDTIDGAPTTPVTRGHLYLMRDELLLVDPWIDIE